jgi:hypothetical protein
MTAMRGAIRATASENHFTRSNSYEAGARLPDFHELVMTNIGERHRTPWHATAHHTIGASSHSSRFVVA